jgi:hypothetical protein
VTRSRMALFPRATELGVGAEPRGGNAGNLLELAIVPDDVKKTKRLLE